MASITRRALAALLPFAPTGLLPILKGRVATKAPSEDQRPPIGDPGEDTAQIALHNGGTSQSSVTTDVTKIYVQDGRFVIRHEDVANHTVSYRYFDLKDPSADDES